VLAVTDCRLASVAPGIFQRLILDNPALGLRVVERLGDIIRRHEQRIVELSTLSAVQRVHVELLRLAKLDVDSSGHWVVSPIPTHSDIASRASTSRETVVRAINRLAVAGIIERRGKALYIRDHGLLSELPTGLGPQMVAAQ
jgi:CRP-like cAMP-binding protein